jgi:protein-S-isoprenylcysteine O-methyltransferase Ste14
VSAHRTRRLPTLGRRGEGWVAAQLVLIAAVLLSPLVAHSRPHGYAPAEYAVGGVLLALGLLLLVAAGLELGSSLTPLPAPRTDPTLSLVTNGPYARARHPMYGAAILFALGWAIVFDSIAGLAFAVALAVLLDLKARREELWLTERYPAYETYRQRTRHRLLPFVY